MPNLSLLEPCMEAEVHALVDFASTPRRTASISGWCLVKWPIPFDYPSHHKVEMGKGWIVRDGSDAICFGYGLADVERVRGC